MTITTTRPDTYITNADDVFDIRDAIAEIEAYENDGSGDAEDVEKLVDLLKSLEGAGGGDHDWRGNWYPVTMIRDSYFRIYAEELAEELDLVKTEIAWPYTCIDWDKASDELQMDYTSVDFDGVTYWFR